jgi:metal-responsive CopG/Arc/MetJ family transcriptional regulator
MPIIKAKQKQDKEQIRISVDKGLLDKIKKYCEWANVTKQDEFFEQAAEFVLSKDKDWHARETNEKCL